MFLVNIRGCVVIKIMDYLKHKQKGQGIVEYAMLLAFIVGIAMMLNGSNLGGAVKGVFDDVAEVIANFTDSRTPEEKDYANMKKIGEGLARNFKHGNSSLSDPYQDEKSDDAVKMPYNYLSVVVLPDGTVDVYFDGYSTQVSSNWYSDMSDADKERYGAALKNAGVDLSEQGIAKTRENLKINSGNVDDSAVKNGYAVGFTKGYGADNNKMFTTYVGFKSDQVNKDTYKNRTSEIPGGPDLIAGYGHDARKITKLDL